MAHAVTTARRLEYAKGYLALGLLVEASDELEAIDGMDRLSVDVMDVRMHLHSEAKQWDLAAACARQVALAKPNEPAGWLTWAYAARRLVDVASAELILLRALEHVKTCALVHFNLACYRCQQGDIPGAKDRLAVACRMDEAIKQLAVTDPDLEPMWADIAAMQ